MMQKDLDDSHLRFQDFEKNHSRQEMLSQSVQKTHLSGAKSLLKSVKDSESIIAIAKGGKPLIIGVEVAGSIDNVKKLGTDPIVQGFEPALKFNGKVFVPTPQAEAAQLESSQDVADVIQAIQSLSAEEVYTRIENRARNRVDGGSQ